LRYLTLILPQPPPLPAHSLPLYCAVPLPDLPSFPTRRSSDLNEAMAESSTGVRFAKMAIAEAKLLGAGIFIPTRSNGGYYGLSRDRKSTRLNSSHVSISYAVFCLKKKNNMSDTGDS